jgi:hypothetical protein
VKSNLPVYIINLIKRHDRKAHCVYEFDHKEEFMVRFVSAFEEDIGAKGLWKTIVQILKNAENEDDDPIIICEDDHQFTEQYNSFKFYQSIQIAKYLKADVVLGGVSYFSNAFEVTKNLFWVESFSGAQFMVIYKKFFKTIIEASFTDFDTADARISQLSNHIFTIFPFISTQRDFGYSDVTASNNNHGRIDNLFRASKEKFHLIQNIETYYQKIIAKYCYDLKNVESSFCVPLYVLDSVSQAEKKYLMSHFQGREEFKINFLTPLESTFERNVTIKKILEDSLRTSEDIVIFCKKDIVLADIYKKDLFINAILKAYFLGSEILLAGVRSFGTVIPIDDNFLWVGSFSAAPAIILFKPVFSKIIHDLAQEESLEYFLSENIVNKIIIFPFLFDFKTVEVNDSIRLDQNFRLESILKLHKLMR